MAKNFKSLGLFGLLVLGAQVASAKEYLIKTKPMMFSSVKNRLQSKAFVGVSVLDTHAVASLVKVDISQKNPAATLAHLMSQPDVEYVVENYKLHRFEAPADYKGLREQWALSKINATKAWQLAGNRGSEKIIVAVIDTGTDYNHESLKANSVKGYDFINNNEDPMDITSSRNPGHGTHCSGIIGATGDVENGTSGIVNKVGLMPIRFLDQNGSGDLMNGIKSIDFAISKKVQVISASWGARVGRSQAQPLIEAVQRADDAGIIFVAAAANDGQSNDKTDMYPTNAGTKNMISVAASGPNDEKPSWSNYGKRTVSLAAPGLNIMSTLPKNTYGNLSGTSMATPLVSGLVALLLAQNENLTGLEVKSLLQHTGAAVQIETACNCRIDAGSAMETLLNKTMWVTPAATTLKVKETVKLNTVNGTAPFTYASQNPDVLSVDTNGIVTAVAKGETRLTVTDSTGKTASTLTLRVEDGSSGSDPGQPGNPQECPLGDPQLCEEVCKIAPSLPWCKK